MTDPRIVSEAQRQMFERAVTDPDYAKSRGITPDLAGKFLAAHKAAGSPKLQERVVASSSAKPKQSPWGKGFGR